MVSEEPNLDELRGLKPADPHEAALHRRRPHPRHKVEHIAPDHLLPEAYHLIIVSQALVDAHPQLILLQAVVLHRCSRLQAADQLVVLLPPPLILHVEYRSICTYIGINTLICAYEA